MPRAKAEELGVPVPSEIGAHGVVAGPDPSLQAQPANAVLNALGRESLTPEALDVIEISEAFASVGIHSTLLLGVDPDRVNVNGGAIALGHSIGASGARLVLTLAYELRRRGDGLGAAGWARRRCAAAVGRATPCCSACRRDLRGSVASRAHWACQCGSSGSGSGGPGKGGLGRPRKEQSRWKLFR